MKKDRAKICEIISEMLDNPNKIGIYPTAKAYDELEQYIDKIRAESLGYAYGFCCALLEKGDDLRTLEVPILLDQAIEDLSK
jgi:hypothetical protein